MIKLAYDRSINESDKADVSTPVINLRKLGPNFDVLSYECKTLTQFFQKLPGFEVVDNIINGLNNPLIRKK